MKNPKAVQGHLLHIDASTPDSVDFSNELRVLDFRFF
jgi:hypothetical protein